MNLHIRITVGERAWDTHAETDINVEAPAEHLGGMVDAYTLINAIAATVTAARAKLTAEAAETQEA